ncbi:hypothetical protein Q8C87_004426 [Salmonella enterica]|uniref:hypothetical protein n=1 Tax=Citrobacter sp. AATXR TaxID=1779183 RepID=UPI000778D9EB|nr:hypothetical protein [Citrobacter sp. AATXR]EIO8242697.1 hypothetical protein [Salmonella enterica subsp. enterica serovar Johannesburg]ELI2672409.1 hypothetical protein [Salmonella enterica]KYC16578.1 hypothetical protein WM45_19555 [Citrobacter sp. AATXR]
MENVVYCIFSIIGAFIILSFVYGGLMETQKERDHNDRRMDRIEEDIYNLEERLDKLEKKIKKYNKNKYKE